MLARFHARDAHQRGQAVRHDLGERAGIFVSNHACHRPCSRGMLRRKRRAATLEKRPPAISLIRSFAPQRVLEGLDRYQAVQRRFASQKASLAPVFVVADLTQQPHPASSSDQGSDSSVGERLVVADGRRILRKVLAKIAIRHEKPGSDPTEWHKPLSIRKAEFRRARPDLFLVPEEISR